MQRGAAGFARRGPQKDGNRAAGGDRREDLSDRGIIQRVEHSGRYHQCETIVAAQE